MSIINSIRSQFSPIHPEGYPFVGGFALVALILFVAVAAARLACRGGDALVRLFLPRSATGHAEARRHSGFAATARSAAWSKPCRRMNWRSASGRFIRISIFMSVFNCHVNRGGRARRGPHRADRLSQGRFRQRRSRQGQQSDEHNMFVIATPAPPPWRATIRWRRRGAVRTRRSGGSRRRGPAHRHDPLRLSRRSVSSRRACRRWSARGGPRPPAERVMAELRVTEPARAFSVG